MLIRVEYRSRRLDVGEAGAVNGRGKIRGCVHGCGCGEGYGLTHAPGSGYGEGLAVVFGSEDFTGSGYVSKLRIAGSFINVG